MSILQRLHSEYAPSRLGRGAMGPFREFVFLRFQSKPRLQVRRVPYHSAKLDRTHIRVGLKSVDLVC